MISMYQASAIATSLNRYGVLKLALESISCGSKQLVLDSPID